jgi:hypothetical protein
MLFERSGKIKTGSRIKCKRLDYGAFTRLAVKEALRGTSESGTAVTNRRVIVSCTRREGLGKMTCKVLDGIREGCCQKGDGVRYRLLRLGVQRNDQLLQLGYETAPLKPSGAPGLVSDRNPFTVFEESVCRFEGRGLRIGRIEESGMFNGRKNIAVSQSAYDCKKDNCLDWSVGSMKSEWPEESTHVAQS